MDIMNCPKCGKLFARINSPICDDCKKLEEGDFQRVRKYIDEYPNSRVAEVAHETGVSVKRIMNYLRDGRLEASAGMSAESILKCDKCGIPIKSGHFCSKCIVSVSQQVTELYKDSPKKKIESNMKTSRFTNDSDENRRLKQNPYKKNN